MTTTTTATPDERTAVLPRVDDAVAAARSSTGAWAGLTAARRRHHLLQWKREMYRTRDEIRAILRDEAGKVHFDATLELTMALHHLDWAARSAGRVLAPERVRPGMMMLDHETSIERRPYGVVGVIGPWNYPVYTPLGSISYALAAGNAVVFTPSEYATCAAEWLGRTFADATGLDDVFRVVPGGPAAGCALTSSDVDKVAFTGSAATGRLVMAACAERLIPVVMELGGKDAAIVADDADISAAVDAILWGATMNAGQSCAGIERVYVVEEVADEFTRILTERARDLRAGVDYGAMTMERQAGIVARHIGAAVADGGRALVGGPQSVRGRLVDPVILADVPEESVAARDETFGPTLIVAVVPDVATAIVRANAVDTGLGGAVFSRRRGRQIARGLGVGMVAINDVVSFGATPALPFGGRGASGFGRIHGVDGLREFTYPVAVSRRRALHLPSRASTHRRHAWDVPSLHALLCLVGRR
ncbi:aldehyde dehydrogenase family protein [Tsukamurella sp. 8F]|uniref:aldehyde dehydrogenase family protein n=1 Tax=unclassified Tsukamurella TaxID=2633480 RepID=UPI0023B9FEDE|nr:MULTISPECIES: aldehyde dehydrogenase family protein [unclassified Tsukamurella]MDF0531311.1 aldehyde dehydrogenase family protein [Tsukamurella sp. 8J]MDF0585260.1 aldehyde dehydrogenase family protein [Tsukamurella sp. 8F]